MHERKRNSSSARGSYRNNSPSNWDACRAPDCRNSPKTRGRTAASRHRPFPVGANVLAGSAVFRRALCTDGIERRHALFIGHRIAHALTAGTAHVVHADRRHGFDPVVDLRGAHRVAPAAADADDSICRIDRRVVRQEIDRRTEILDTYFGRFDPARIAAFAVIRGIESQGNIAPLRQAAGIENPRSAPSRLRTDGRRWRHILGRINPPGDKDRRPRRCRKRFRNETFRTCTPFSPTRPALRSRRAALCSTLRPAPHVQHRLRSGRPGPPFDDCQQVAQFIGFDSMFRQCPCVPSSSAPRLRQRPVSPPWRSPARHGSARRARKGRRRGALWLLRFRASTA